MPNKKEAYAIGKELGAQFIRENGSELAVTDGYGGYATTPEALASDCFETYNQFSPWEQTASAWNATGDRADGLWEAFNRGMDVGARREARARGF